MKKTILLLCIWGINAMEEKPLQTCDNFDSFVDIRDSSVILHHREDAGPKGRYRYKTTAFQQFYKKKKLAEILVQKHTMKNAIEIIWIIDHAQRSDDSHLCKTLFERVLNDFPNATYFARDIMQTQWHYFDKAGFEKTQSNQGCSIEDENAVIQFFRLANFERKSK